MNSVVPGSARRRFAGVRTVWPGRSVERAAAATLVTLCLSGCATSGPDLQFHELALEPAQRVHKDKSFDLPFDAYVIGVEKDRRSRVGQVAECPAGQAGAHCLRFDAPYFAAHPEIAANLRDKLAGQHRPTFVSHIASFARERPKACFFYNLHSAAEPCRGAAAAPPAEGDRIAQGWTALEALRSELAARAASLRPTHLVTFVMGWNTPQWEALQNYRDLHDRLEAAAQEHPETPFRPLYIGLTWPSTGFPLIPSLDYGIKAKDADEVGALWINILLQRVVAPVKRELGARVLVIGHSFGARASSRAVFSAPLLGDEPGEPVVDLLVGLQGAYSYQRYVADNDGSSPEGIEGAPYRDFRRFVGKSVLTASRHDTAVRAAGHGPYFVGSDAAYARTQEAALAAVFQHAQATATGSIGLAGCDRSTLLHVDASAIVHENVPGTGGGAHSDIFTPEMGRLIHELLRACAQP